MSQAHTTDSEGRNNHQYGINNRPKFKNSRGRGKYYYPSRYPYPNRYLGFQPHWSYYNWKRPPLFRRPPLLKTPEKQRSKSPSPGTEEYNLRKIQETSDMIKKQLLMPPECVEEIRSSSEKETVDSTEKSDEISDKKQCESEKSSKLAKKPMQYNVEEIHNKIINHITKLNHGKKMNLICATSSGYDVAIQQIQKQKRLELSKVLRDMCSNQNSENSEVINSIIPDIGIKIEDLPLEVIQELSSTLDYNFDEASLPDDNRETVKIKSEVFDIDINESDLITNIKEEKDRCDEVDNMEILPNPPPGDDFPNHSIHSEPEFPPNPEFADHPIKSEPEFPSEPIKSDLKVSIETQTDSIGRNSSSTQTDFDVLKSFEVNTEPENLNKAIKVMFEIDNEIARLTELRQKIFLKLNTKSVEKPKTKTQKSPQKQNDHDLYRKELDLEIQSEKILVVQVFRDTLVAGTESGKLFYVSAISGRTLYTYNLGDFPITCFCISGDLKKSPHIFVGSFDTKIKECEFEKERVLRVVKTQEGVQCMEMEWHFIFIGTVRGLLLRYSLKKMKLEFEERISPDRILVLKATQEGARRVLLVGTKNSPVCVRDAMSGLHMRTMHDVICPTVYSLLLENSLVYCATPFHDILVYRFHDGVLMHKYQASNSKGVGSMKIVENLLFASSYNGNIYVYNTKTRKYVGVIEGPGGIILSMEVFKNLLIVGTMSFHFKSLLIPDYILESNKL